MEGSVSKPVGLINLKVKRQRTWRHTGRGAVVMVGSRFRLRFHHHSEKGSPLPPSSVGTWLFQCVHLQQQHGEVCSPAYPCSSCQHCGTPAASQPPHALQGHTRGEDILVHLWNCIQTKNTQKHRRSHDRSHCLTWNCRGKKVSLKMNGGHSISNNAPDFLQNATKQFFFGLLWKVQVQFK